MSTLLELESKFKLKPTFNFNKDLYKKIGFNVIEYDKCYIFNANLYFNKENVKYIKFIYNDKKILPINPYGNNLGLINILTKL